VSNVRVLDRGAAIARPLGGRTERPLSAAEQIAGAVMRQILEGDYRLGERIKEQELAETFGVSRGPVRDALRILAADGIVELLPNRGAHVTELTIEEVHDIFEIREALYGVCSRLLAARRTPRVLEALRVRMADLEASERDEDATAYTQASFELAKLIANEAGNARLADILSSLARQTSRYARLGMETKARRRRSLSVWKQLCQAIEDGDTDGAETLGKTLIGESRAAAIAALESGQDVVTAAARRAVGA